MGIVVVPLDRAFHPLDLAVSLGVVDFCQLVLDAVLHTDPVEDMDHRVAGLLPVGKLDAVVSQNGVDPVRQSHNQVAQECKCRM